MIPPQWPQKVLIHQYFLTQLFCLWGHQSERVFQEFLLWSHFQFFQVFRVFQFFKCDFFMNRIWFLHNLFTRDFIIWSWILLSPSCHIQVGILNVNFKIDPPNIHVIFILVCITEIVWHIIGLSALFGRIILGLIRDGEAVLLSLILVMTNTVPSRVAFFIIIFIVSAAILW